MPVLEEIGVSAGYLQFLVLFITARVEDTDWNGASRYV